MLSNGTVIGDGSWVLNIFVSDLELSRQFRVKGDMHIGGVMLKIVEDLDVTRDWSDHALWWPERNRWLSHTRSSLDQYGVSADAQLIFTPMHKMITIQLPDFQNVSKRVNFSVPIFNSVVDLCKELGIRYPEEVSLKRYIPPDLLAKGVVQQQPSGLCHSKKHGGSTNSVLINKTIASSQSVQHLDSTTINIATGKMPIYNSSHNLIAAQGTNGRTGSLPPTPRHKTVKGTPEHVTNGGTLPLNRGTLPRHMATYNTISSTNGCHGNADGGVGGGTGGHSPDLATNGTTAPYDRQLADTPLSPALAAEQAQAVGVRPKNYVHKAALNAGWLDSSRSLQEQGVGEEDFLMLRFKFLAFFDLNPKYDPVRINQIYEQAKWSIFMEEIDFTDEEAYMFAALQLQVQLRAQIKRIEGSEIKMDDVDVLLNELENTLETPLNGNFHSDITAVPELSDYLKYFKPKKLTLKSYRKAYFTFKDLVIRWYNSSEDSNGVPQGQINLKGAEVTNDVNVSEGKFIIKLLIPSAEGMSEFWFKCDTEHQYVKWLAGCKLASRGKTMADAAYSAEVQTTRRLLAMQHPTPVSSTAPAAALGDAHDFDIDRLLPRRLVKKARSREQMARRVLEAHAGVQQLPLIEAKMEYVKAWQALPDFGHHYFVVRFRGARKPELLCVTYNRMMKLNLDTGETLKTWRFSSLKKWHVNWEIKHIFVQMEDEEIEFSCLSADCKVVHEFIGGYIFLSMRSKDQNQTLNEELFHKLTGGWQ